MTAFRISSWNVNGLRAAVRGGFLGWLRRHGGDVVAVQEVRAAPRDLPPEIGRLRSYRTHFQSAERKGYSGVGLFSRQPPERVDVRLGRRDLDVEGRLQIARFGRLHVVNSYFPNGSGKNRNNDRVPFKLRYYRALFERLEPARRRGDPIVVVGDFNTAHRDIDLSRPRQNQKTSGFLPEERAELDRWLREGWVDSFRHLHPGRGGAYTWWSQRPGVREKNVGWRIDYALLSPGALPHLRDASIQSRVRGSDHCPIHVVLDRSVLDGSAPGGGTPASLPPGVREARSVI